ncbi:MAG: hypothetical protein N3F08_01430 [Crenarchaeota archaeon]|nr:hypothetical protein [Thermoproteota archaeon]
MWAYEIAERMSKKYGFVVMFNVDYESGFRAIFNSTEMSDEQLINEIMRKVDAMVEAGEMLENEEMMNEFLASREIGVEKSKRRGALGRNIIFALLKPLRRNLIAAFFKVPET